MRKLLSVLLLSSLLFIGCTTTTTTDIRPSDDTNPDDPLTQELIEYDVELEEGTTRFRGEFEGNSTWTYTVKVDAPTPCHTVLVDEIVAESFPEQVSINVAIMEPEDDIACIQVLDTQIIAGEFQASESATIKLNVGN